MAGVGYGSGRMSIGRDFIRNMLHNSCRQHLCAATGEFIAYERALHPGHDLVLSHLVAILLEQWLDACNQILLSAVGDADK